MVITAYKVGNKVVVAGVTAGLVYELAYVKTDVKQRKATQKGQISIAFSKGSTPTSINVNGNKIPVSNTAPPTPVKTPSGKKTLHQTPTTQKLSLSPQAASTQTIMTQQLPKQSQLQPIIW